MEHVLRKGIGRNGVHIFSQFADQGHPGAGILLVPHQDPGDDRVIFPGVHPALFGQFQQGDPFAYRQVPAQEHGTDLLIRQVDINTAPDQLL